MPSLEHQEGKEDDDVQEMEDEAPIHDGQANDGQMDVDQIKLGQFAHVLNLNGCNLLSVKERNKILQCFKTKCTQ